MSGLAAVSDNIMRNDDPLVIFIQGDFTKPTSGSHVRFCEFVEFATRTYSKVVVYSYEDHSTAPWTADAQLRFRRRFPKAALVLERPGAIVRLFGKIKGLALLMVPGLAARILSWRLPGQTPRWDALQSHPRSRFIVHFVDSLTELNGISSASTILDTHDIKFVRRAKTSGDNLFSVRSVFRMRAEVGQLAVLRGLIAISQSEAAIFRSLLPAGNILLIPKFLRDEVVVPQAEKSIDLLFVGSNNAFNVDGVARFLESNRNWLGKYRIAIAGQVCASVRVRSAADLVGNIELLGFVDDLVQLYARARSVISPVDGTGLNIKVVEALAHGKPVFGSEHSRAALVPGHAGAVFNDTRQEIERVLGDEAVLHLAEIAARNYSHQLSSHGDVERLIASLDV